CRGSRPHAVVAAQSIVRRQQIEFHRLDLQLEVIVYLALEKHLVQVEAVPRWMVRDVVVGIVAGQRHLLTDATSVPAGNPDTEPELTFVVPRRLEIVVNLDRSQDESDPLPAPIGHRCLLSRTPRGARA